MTPNAFGGAALRWKSNIGKVIIPNDVTCQKYPIILFYEGCNYKSVQENSLNFDYLTSVNIKVCQVSAVIQVLYIWFAPLSNFLLVWLHDWSRNDAFLRISQFNNYKKKYAADHLRNMIIKTNSWPLQLTGGFPLSDAIDKQNSFESNAN